MSANGSMTRRAVLQTAGLCAATGRLWADDRMQVVDCHAHIYATDEERYPTIPTPKRPPPGTGTIEHLRREMASAGVRYVTAIQTSSYYRWDNRFTADSASRLRDFMVGVVTLDPDDPSSPEQLEQYATHSNVRGMRSVPAKSGNLFDPGVERLWKTAERLGIVINVLCGPEKRPEIETLIERCPRLSVVIDHCLNLKAGPTAEPTLGEMRTLARQPTVHAKLTFVPTGSREPFPCSDLHDACRAIVDAFGPQRCVWGSDFPCELWCPKVSYGQHLRIFTHELGFDAETRRAILSDTARRLWWS